MPQQNANCGSSVQADTLARTPPLMPVPRSSPSNGTTNGTARSTAGTLVVPAPTSASGPLTSPAEATATNKILGRNVNGTLVMTSAPSNEAELQLYRVMQRASLLAYYDTLLEMGGDDVQQLCEAGEEEFLEIMALVGMASKPLHVRRLQKALQEWVNNPAMFQAPVLPTAGGGASGSPVFPSSGSTSSTSSLQEQQPPRTPSVPHAPPPLLHMSLQMSRPSPPAITNGPPTPRHSSPSPGPTVPPIPGPASHTSSGGAPSPGLPLHVQGGSESPGSPPCQLTPTLNEAQITRLAESARSLATALPPTLEPKPHNSKKRVCKELELVLTMSEDDPRRMEEIRKFAAIYGRFDCKRKPEKPLTLHEVSVNEAAAQICRLVPALLTRRDELFPLARQVVRDSGYQYSKTHIGDASSSGCYSRAHNGDEGGPSSGKRPRLNEHGDELRRQERLEQISDELRAVAERQEELRRLASGGGAATSSEGPHGVWHSQLEALAARHAQLAGEQAELGAHRHRGYRRSARISAASSGGDGERDTDVDTDSQFSYSNTSSPSQDIGDSRDSSRADNESSSKGKISKQLVQETLLGEGLRVVRELVEQQQQQQRRFDNFYHPQEAKVQVISASGGNIIAVANPALSMSPAILPPDPSTSQEVTSRSPRSFGLQIKQESLSPCKQD